MRYTGIQWSFMVIPQEALDRKTLQIICDMSALTLCCDCSGLVDSQDRTSTSNLFHYERPTSENFLKIFNTSPFPKCLWPRTPESNYLKEMTWWAGLRKLISGTGIICQEPDMLKIAILVGMKQSSLWLTGKPNSAGQGRCHTVVKGVNSMFVLRAWAQSWLV